jgi:BirA family biotin operon repressor/biotin-[acetyl-CoA-carboxylase] ligase
MHLTPSQIKLLQLLGDSACHSGSELGVALNVTRSAIWKQINHLIELGIPVKRISHQGYQLPNKLILLNKEYIADHLLDQKLSMPFNLHVLHSIDSTNRYLKDLPVTNSIEVCCAEIQTEGKGRFGRNWHSPFGENIYCSSRWNLNYDLAKLSGLSLVSSLAVLATLHELHLATEIKIKWPNDILWADKKLCGSLIEIMAESNNNNVQIIIGIGLNVNSDTQSHPLPDKAWCSLYEITRNYFDRNFIITKLITNLDRYLNKFMQNNLIDFMDEWNKSDYLVGKNITITQSSNTLTGVACGINQIGQLILQDKTGLKHFLSAGDTSLQK